MKKYLMLPVLFVVLACQGTKSEKMSEEEMIVHSNTDHHNEAINKVFEAHGGFGQWSALKQMSYDLDGSRTLVDLQSRYTRIESEHQTVGFDGEKVWVMPPSENAQRQRMRYNLMFYFYAFPFVVGDPGASYEGLAPITLLNQTYDAVKVSYGEGVGDSPKDNYIILSGQESHQMEWLMYTATFGAAEGKDTYSLIKYEGWKERSGVVLPTSLQWYQYKDGVVGEPRGNARIFDNVMVATAYPEMNKFTIPEGAQVLE